MNKTIENSKQAPIATGVNTKSLSNLRRWNIGLAILHSTQALAILLLTSSFAIPVLASYIDGPPGATNLVTSTLFSVRIGWVIVFFLSLAAIDHLLTATVGRKTYEGDLKRGINRFRWVEYSFSATAMVLILAMYWGITSINALIVIAGANVAMILFGWIQELMNPPGRTKTTMFPFWCGSLVAITPWIAMAINIPQYSDVPPAIYAILIVQGILFFCFALNQWLQYKGIGKWTSYVRGEKTYLVLSLVAKSLLAWQVFAVSLAA